MVNYRTMKIYVGSHKLLVEESSEFDLKLQIQFELNLSYFIHP